MIGRLVVPPTLAASVFLGDLFGGTGGINAALNLAALVILIAGFFVVGRYKAALDATAQAAEAWKLERGGEGRARGCRASGREGRDGGMQGGIANLRITQLEATTDIRTLIEALDAKTRRHALGLDEITEKLDILISRQNP